MIDLEGRLELPMWEPEVGTRVEGDRDRLPNCEVTSPGDATGAWIVARCTEGGGEVVLVAEEGVYGQGEDGSDPGGGGVDGVADLPGVGEHLTDKDGFTVDVSGAGAEVWGADRGNEDGGGGEDVTSDGDCFSTVGDRLGDEDGLGDGAGGAGGDGRDSSAERATAAAGDE